MSYQPYADVKYYSEVYGGTTIPASDLDKALNIANRHIDALTYNRIVGRGINALTSFQQDIVREVCCMIADFEYENADLIQSVLQSYSINGVSMNFGSSWNIFVSNGIAIRRDNYALLNQTGLCSSSLGV